MEDDIKGIALKAAHEGGAVLMKHFGKITSVTHKGEIDLVTEADKEAELTIVSIIKASYPHHRILAEETGESGASSSCKWIVDPLTARPTTPTAIPVFAFPLQWRWRERYATV